MWSDFQTQTYQKILHTWQIVNFLAFVLIALALRRLVPRGLSASMGYLIFLNLLLTPSLGLLCIYWQPMNDLVALSMMAWALVFFTRGQSAPALLAIGLAALGREQILMLLPFVYLFFPFAWWQAVGLAALPYLAVVFFPVFPHIVPLFDSSSSQTIPALSATASYLHFLDYHWHFLWSQRGLAIPYGIILNMGVPLLIAHAAGVWRNWRFVLLFCLCFIFVADRHMVPIALIAVAALYAHGVDRARLADLRNFFVALLLCKLLLLLCSQSAAWLQAELWYTLFLNTRFFRKLFQGFWAASLLLAGFTYYWRRKMRKDGT